MVDEEDIREGEMEAPFTGRKGGGGRKRGAVSQRTTVRCFSVRGGNNCRRRGGLLFNKVMFVGVLNGFYHQYKKVTRLGQHLPAITHSVVSKGQVFFSLQKGPPNSSA